MYSSLKILIQTTSVVIGFLVLANLMPLQVAKYMTTLPWKKRTMLANIQSVVLGVAKVNKFV